MPTRKHTPSYLWSYGAAPVASTNQRVNLFGIISDTDSQFDAISIRRVKGFMLPKVQGSGAEAYGRGWWGFIYIPPGATLTDPNSGSDPDKADVLRRVFGATPWCTNLLLSVPFATGVTKFWIPRGGQLQLVIYTDVFSSGAGVQFNVSMTGRYKMYRRDTGTLLDMAEPDDAGDDDEEG